MANDPDKGTMKLGTEHLPEEVVVQPATTIVWMTTEGDNPRRGRHAVGSTLGDRVNATITPQESEYVAAVLQAAVDKVKRTQKKLERDNDIQVHTSFPIQEEPTIFDLIERLLQLLDSDTSSIDKVEELGVNCLKCRGQVVYDFYCENCMPTKVRRFWPDRGRIDVILQDQGTVLKRLHEQGKMHNRMMCPVCREEQQHPARVRTSEPWKGQ